MQSYFVVAFIALLAISSVSAQTNCNEIEFDAFNLNNNNNTLYDLAQLLTPGTGNDGISFSNVQYPITLYRPIINGRIEIQIILSPNQGFVPTIFPNGSIIDVYYTIVPDSLTLSLNDGFPITEVYNPAGNNFTFLNFNGNGSAAVVNTLAVSVIQNSSAPGATASCTSVYSFLITNPPNATVRGDPQFMGLRGQSYQIHGIDGAVYNIISDRDVQLNSRFSFLTGPRPCPTMPSTGRKSSACWSHQGSYLGEIGLKVGADQVFVASGPASIGFSAITVNGKQMRVGESTNHVQFNSTHEVTLTFGAWTIELENSDMFINLRSVRVASSAWSSLSSHGLLGQTWANKRYSGKVAAIEGEVDDYMIGENSVFGDSFVFNRFQAE